jgi:DNA-binding transcriptional ArsR family regulator
MPACPAPAIADASDNPLASRGDVDVGAIAKLIADRARSAILHALLDGTSRPAGELARMSGVAPATASAHLARLVSGGMLKVTAAGRHRYYSLTGPDVAAALEALAMIAPPVPVRSLRQSRQVETLREARRCYDHLAGRLGVELRNRIMALGPAEAVLTRALSRLGVNPPPGAARDNVRDCMDWTERRPHLAGPLAAAALTALIDSGRVRAADGRELRAEPGALEWLIAGR